jgi:MFS family permease
MLDSSAAREILLRRRWVIVGLLFIAGFLNYLDRSIISVVLPLLGQELNLGPAQKGILLSAFFWSYTLMLMPIGWLCDRFDMRWLYAGAFALWSLTCGVTGFAGSLGVLISLRIMLGIGESIYSPGGMKVVSALFHSRERGLAAGLVNCGTRAGLAFGVPLIALVVAALGWKRSFFLLGFASLVWLIPWLFLYPAGVNTSNLHGQLRSNRKVGRISRNVLGLSLGHIGYGYYFYLLVTWLPAYLVESRHMSLTQAGAYAFVPYIVFALGEPIGGWIADRLIALGWNELFIRKLIISIAYLASVMLLAAGRADDNRSAMMLLGAASLVGLSTGNIYALIQRMTTDGEVGFATGFLNFAGNLSGIVAPIVTGLIIARTGSYYPAFVVAVIVLLAALPIYWTMVREELGGDG